MLQIYYCRNPQGGSELFDYIMLRISRGIASFAIAHSLFPSLCYEGISKLEKYRSPEVQKFSHMHKYLIIRYH